MGIVGGVNPGKDYLARPDRPYLQREIGSVTEFKIRWWGLCV
jgi:hypothetical protein